MKYNVEQLVTVKAYAEAIKYDEMDAGMIRIEDYAKEMKKAAINAQNSSLMSVTDYVESMKGFNAIEDIIMSEVEAKIAFRAENEANYLEEKLA